MRDAKSIATESIMLLTICVGIIILTAVMFLRGGEDRFQKHAEMFRQACESTGGKAVWNNRFWECLK